MLSENAKYVLEKRYLSKDENGNPTETIDGMFHRVAHAIAKADKNYGDDPQKAEDEFYEMMTQLEFMPNSPTLMNAGKELGQLSACFVLPVDDSIDSIFDAIKQAAIIHKSGGGTGFSFSRIRGNGSTVASTGGIASGPVSFMKVFNSATEAIKQGGCFVGDTLVATANGPKKIKDLKEGDLVYSYDHENGMVLRPCSGSWITKRNTEVWKLETDKGLSVIGTPDHPIMRRTGQRLSESEYIKLSELSVGTPLMPLTRYKKRTGNKKVEEYFISLHDGNDTRMPEHIWIAREAGIEGEVIHHKDGNHLNNNIDNLEGLKAKEHSKKHNIERMENGTHPFLHLSEEQKRKNIENLQNYHKNLSDEEREENYQKIRDGVKGENQRRIALGQHNFINNPPMRNAETLLIANRNRVATTIWKLQEMGCTDLTENNFCDECKKAELPNTYRFKIETINKWFGSFENALNYADERNNKVTYVGFWGNEDVWNVEVEDTHNYVVCNEDMSTGIVVSNTRRGANMGLLSCTHPDILEFITCKEDNSEINNFNISIGLTEKFMNAVDLGDDYDLIDPRTKMVVGKLDAREVFNKIVESAWKNGEPGIVFLDRLNKDNIVPKQGEIEATNPCVIGDTLILTDKGYVPIIECVNKPTMVWNGKEWSEVVPRKTGENQELLKITISDGNELICTPYHKFILENGKVVEAKELQEETALKSCEFPIIDGEKELKNAYTQGFFAGDGFNGSGRPAKYISFYNGKRHCKDFCALVSCRENSEKRETYKVDVDFEKEFVPDASYTIKSRLDWLAGLMDSDGGMSKDNVMTIGSANKAFLVDTSRMLNTLGLRCKVSFVRGERDKYFPEGCGDSVYHCQNEYRIIIAGSDLTHLRKLGLETHRHDISDINTRRGNKKAPEVEKIEKLNEREDVYCFTENILHTGVFNGVYTRNCGEQPLLPFESCNLGSINLTKMVKATEDGYELDKDKLKRTVTKAVHFLDNVIDENVYPLKKIDTQTKKTRKIGLGVMGWADLLLMLKIPYNSERAISLAEDVMKLINDTGHKASANLAKKRGTFPLFKESTLETEERNGTITTIAPTGCQNPYTIVGTDNGLLRLGEIVDKNGEKWQPKSDIKAYQEKGKNLITKGFVNGFADTKKVILSNNLELEATHNHRFKVIRNGICDWVRTDELQIGDIIPSKIGYYKNSNEYEFKSIEQTINNKSKEAKLPLKMDKKLAFFLGVYYANGSNHYAKNGNFNSVRLSFNSAKQNDIDYIIELIKDLYGLDVKPFITKGRETVTELCIANRNLCDWLELNGLKKQKANSVEIPKAIRMSSAESIESFIDGYWLCDGSITANTKYIDTSSKQMAKDLLVLLRAIGIDAKILINIKRVGAKSDNPMYRVYFVKYRSVNGESAYRYVDKNKREKLEEVRNIMGGRDYVYDEVTEITDSQCMTLDVEVDDEHYYLANGVISHNTISIIGSCSSGIEPIFAYVFIRNVMDGTQMIEVNPILKEEFEKRGIYSDELMKRIAKEGTIQHIEGIPDDIKRVFVSSHDISPEYHVRMQAAFQKYTDNAVSKTVNFKNEATKEDIARVYQLAYRTGCKGTTVYRDGSRDEQVLNIGSVSGNQKEEVQKGPRERPDVTYGVTEKIRTGCGNLYVTVNYDEEGICEVFTNTSKSGGCPSQSEATARLASLVLKSGIGIDDLCEQIKGIRCPSTIRQPGMKCTSCPDAIAKVIQKEYKKFQNKEQNVFVPSSEETAEQTEKVDVCPECGSPLEHESGCVICRNCSYSKCG